MMGLSLVLTTETFFLPEYESLSRLLVGYYFISSILEDCVLVLPAISFVVFLLNLHKRFVGLNSLLRFNFLIMNSSTRYSATLFTVCVIPILKQDNISG